MFDSANSKAISFRNLQNKAHLEWVSIVSIYWLLQNPVLYKAYYHIIHLIENLNISHDSFPINSKSDYKKFWKLIFHSNKIRI